MQPSAAKDSQSPKSRFGVFEFDPQARELTKHGVRLKVQEQPIQILAVLLEQAGQIVSREELQRRLWPEGTFVDYEQSLNKAVNKLREALGDSAAKPIYIETLARRGYRFVAPVEVDRPTVVEWPKEDTAQERKPARSHARLRWGAGVLALVAAGVLITGLWPVPPVKARLTRLAAGGRRGVKGLVVHDGRILYEAPPEPPNLATRCCWSVSTDGGEPRREVMPFLDPEHNECLFQPNPKLGVITIQNDRVKPGGALWLARFDGSKPRKICETVEGDTGTYSVSPDLKTVLRAGKEGLYARPVDGGPERLLARIDWDGPSLPFWHPSGERIGFTLYKHGTAKAWEVKADGTGMRPVLPDFQAEQWGPWWSPDGKRMYFGSQGGNYVLGGRRWLGWMRRPQPEQLTAASVSLSGPVEDPSDPRVLYAVGESGHGESMKLNRQTNIFEPYLDGLPAINLDYSPGGQWIAYVGDPGMELWKCRRDGSDKVLLEGGMWTRMPRWSPDGKRLAFAATREGPEPWRIYTIAAAGGKAEPVKGVNGAGFDPNWSPDGKRLVFAPWDYDGHLPKQEQHVSIVDLETGAVQMVLGSEDMFSPRWSPDGKNLVAGSVQGGRFFIYDFKTQRWTDSNVKDLAYPMWSKDSRYVYGNIIASYKLVRLDVATRKAEEIRTIKEFRLTPANGWGVSWTPDGEPIVLADLTTWDIYRIDVQ